jgi:rhodanese-related sulfurtransferase
MPPYENIEQPETVRLISRRELAARMRHPGVAVVDVLTPEHYADGHIPGAINLPLAEIQSRAPEALPERDQEIIAYCAGFA